MGQSKILPATPAAASGDTDDIVDDATDLLFGKNGVLDLTNDGTDVYLSEYSYSIGEIDETSNVGELTLNLTKLAAPASVKDAAAEIARFLYATTENKGANVAINDLKDSSGASLNLPVKLYTKSEYATFLEDVVSWLEDFKAGGKTYGAYNLTTDTGVRDFQNQIDSFFYRNSPDEYFESETLVFDAQFSDATNSAELWGLTLTDAGEWSNIALKEGKFVESANATNWSIGSASNPLGDVEKKNTTSSDEDEEDETVTVEVSVLFPADAEGTTLTLGDTIILLATGKVNDKESTEVSYQWYKDGTAISSDGDKALYIPTEAGVYYCIGKKGDAESSINKNYVYTVTAAAIDAGEGNAEKGNVVEDIKVAASSVVPVKATYTKSTAEGAATPAEIYYTWEFLAGLVDDTPVAKASDPNKDALPSGTATSNAEWVCAAPEDWVASSYLLYKCTIDAYATKQAENSVTDAEKGDDTQVVYVKIGFEQ